MSSRSHHHDHSPHHKHKHHRKHKKRSSPSRHRRSRSSSPEQSRDRDRHHRPKIHKARHHDDEKHARHREHSPSPRRREKEHHNKDSKSKNGDLNRRDYRDSYEHSKHPPVRIKQERDENDEKRRKDHKNKPTNPFQTESTEYGQPGTSNSANNEASTQPKQGPDFGLSGKLAEETNTFRGVVIKYNEPPEARKPKKKWRLYVFKGQEQLPVLHVHRQSAYLLGRDRIVADIPIDHPSCSKQHAVLQFRLVNYQRDDGTTGRRVKPFVIDLNSSNGTVVNNNKIEPQRYVELFEKDVVKFGYSSRDYVLLHEKTSVEDTDEEDDKRT